MSQRESGPGETFVDELARHVAYLKRLLDDPHPGLITWCLALNEAIRQVIQFYGGRRVVGDPAALPFQDGQRVAYTGSADDACTDKRQVPIPHGTEGDVLGCELLDADEGVATYLVWVRWDVGRNWSVVFYERDPAYVPENVIRAAGTEG